MFCIKRNEKISFQNTFMVEDLNILLSSNYMFARKFDEIVDKQIIDEIYLRYGNVSK